MNKILVNGFKGMYNSSKMLVDILSIIKSTPCLLHS